MFSWIPISSSWINFPPRHTLSFLNMGNTVKDTVTRLLKNQQWLFGLFVITTRIWETLCYEENSVSEIFGWLFAGQYKTSWILQIRNDRLFSICICVVFKCFCEVQRFFFPYNKHVHNKETKDKVTISRH